MTQPVDAAVTERREEPCAEPQEVPPGEWLAYSIGSETPRLVRASSQRVWMDESKDRFAYRCLPLVIANQLGWDILNPVPFRARWLGGAAANEVQVETLGDSKQEPWASGHFGQGVLTFDVGYLFRTPPGLRLLVTGPLNEPKPNLYPLSGVVETDWSHATFTMNYQLTRPGEWVEFAKDEPFCRILPLSLAVVEELQGRLRVLADDPELQARYRAWAQSRDAFHRHLNNPFSEDRRRGWQKDYFQGQLPDGQRQEGHQTKLYHRDFIDERPDVGPTVAPAARPKQKPDTAPATSSHDFLWRESRPFDVRVRKSVQVMAAIAQTVDRVRPLGGAEEPFLACYRRFSEASSEAFTQVCLEPRSYFWIRVGFQLIDALVNGREISPLARDYCSALGAADIRQAVKIHLDRFVEFEAAARGIDGHAPAAADAPRPPVLDVGGASIRLDPAALAGLGVSAVEPAIAAGREYQVQHANLITDARGAIQQYTPEIFAQVRDQVRVVALKPSRDGEYSNVSISELPGAMLLTVVEHPLVMADRIIHEFHHHRLFSIEDGDPLLESGTTRGQRLARYYSPWRDDPRPIRGILHGTYVFVAVGRFWLAVYEAGDRPADRPYMLDQLLKIGKQLALAQDVLASNARFTPIGEGAFEQLTADIAALHQRMQQAGLPEDTPALRVTDAGEFLPQTSVVTGRPLSVAEAIDEHIARFES